MTDRETDRGRERDRERKIETERDRQIESECVCVCVCVHTPRGARKGAAFANDATPELFGKCPA